MSRRSGTCALTRLKIQSCPCKNKPNDPQTAAVQTAPEAVQAPPTSHSSIYPGFASKAVVKQNTGGKVPSHSKKRRVYQDVFDQEGFGRRQKANHPMISQVQSAVDQAKALMKLKRKKCKKPACKMTGGRQRRKRLYNRRQCSKKSKKSSKRRKHGMFKSA